MKGIRRIIIITALIPVVVIIGMYSFNSAENLPSRKSFEAIKSLRDIIEEQSKRLQALKEENDSLKDKITLQKDPVALSKEELNQRNEEKDPFKQGIEELVEKASRINELFRRSPHLEIPEMALLSRIDWLNLSEKSDLSSNESIVATLAKFRYEAKQRFIPVAQEALSKYIKEHQGNFPKNTSDLKNYFTETMPLEILARYTVVPYSTIPKSPSQQDENAPEYVIKENSVADKSKDSYIFFYSNGTKYISGSYRSNLPTAP